MKRTHIAILVVILVIIFDQVLKFWIKTTMFYGEEINVIGDWFKLNFVENEGMAFGMTFGGKTGKVLLTLFRIAAVIFIGYFLSSLIKKKSPKGLILSMSLILAGALGNIIDSVFYGVIFEHSDWHLKNIAKFMPEGGGYAGLLHGKVVDMFYFPLIQGIYPSWFPIVGGDYFLFFRPVFNIADAAISVGVIMILVFQKRYFNESIAESKEQDEFAPESVTAEADASEENRAANS